MPLKHSPQFFKDFLDNLNETASLMDFHSDAAGTGPGRKYDVEVLNKSAVVLTVACWEAFVEDLARASVDHLLSHGIDHTVFPESVRERVSSKTQGIHAWKLAGDGWRSVMKDNLSEVLGKTIGALNTPKTGQVDELFLKTVGYPKISSTWKWKGRTAKSASADLDALVTLRGGIAHRVKATRAVHKSDVTAAIDLVCRLAAKSHNEMRSFLSVESKVEPWKQVRYKGMA